MAAPGLICMGQGHKTMSSFWAIIDLTHVAGRPESTIRRGIPGRLWSLFDMLKVNAESFVSAIDHLAYLQALARDFENTLVRKGATVKAIEIKDRKAVGVDDTLGQLRHDCEVLELRYTIKHINRCLDSGPVVPSILRSTLEEIVLRFRDELENVSLYALDHTHAEFYEQSQGDWGKVVERFCCAFDIDEARKCFGLDRYTASVFHLMKVVEAGVLEMQVFLRSSDVKAHFGSVVGKLENMTQKMEYQHIPAHLQPYLPFMREILTQLHAVKDSWRNKVAHVDAFIIPSDTFTEELANGVHDATLLLMNKMADGLPPRQLI